MMILLESINNKNVINEYVEWIKDIKWILKVNPYDIEIQYEFALNDSIACTAIYVTSVITF